MTVVVNVKIKNSSFYTFYFKLKIIEIDKRIINMEIHFDAKWNEKATHAHVIWRNEMKMENALKWTEIK